jgi:hypothetical protein
MKWKDANGSRHDLLSSLAQHLSAETELWIVGAPVRAKAAPSQMDVMDV